jgi:hypothetical protein
MTRKALAVLALICAATSAQAQNLSSEDLARRTIERRAVEAAIWGMPIVSVDAMRQAFLRDAGGRYNDIVYLSQQADWKFQITTPNASSWYVYIPINLKNGPIVLDLPAAVGAGCSATSTTHGRRRKPMSDLLAKTKARAGST